MSSESEPSPANSSPPADQRGTDAADLVLAALDHLRGVHETGGSSFGPPTLACQKENLRQWADRLGLLLDHQSIASRLTRGGQEHDFFREGERVFKVTRNGVFGLSPGIELALVSSGQDARRFHLWEASPLEYLERLHLQNLLVPGLNAFEGLIVQPGDDMAIVTSQPRFDIVPVTTAEIDAWFASLGFVKITDAAYYRAEDNLGVFDAHDKNLVRADEDVLVPFDVIPCHPAGGFLAFIEETLSAGHTLRAIRTVTTHRQP
ncbi:MAG: hypothetical protein CFE26_07925 [Verrucomicrobiales bacterium VVV1]|nr:MAG: hypothetical protein CFE26_07925 [Verrucomicrobiales bacterium VVV1]